MFTSYDKAIVAFITPLIMSLLIPLGITGDTTVSSALNLLVTAAVTMLTVFLTKNK